MTAWHFRLPLFFCANVYSFRKKKQDLRDSATDILPTKVSDLFGNTPVEFLRKSWELVSVLLLNFPLSLNLVTSVICLNICTLIC